MQAHTSPLLMQCYRQCFAGDGAVVDEPCLVAHALVAAACARLAAVLRKPPSQSKVCVSGNSIARIECRPLTAALLNVAAVFAPTCTVKCIVFAQAAAVLPLEPGWGACKRDLAAGVDRCRAAYWDQLGARHSAGSLAEFDSQVRHTCLLLRRERLAIVQTPKGRYDECVTSRVMCSSVCLDTVSHKSWEV